MDPLLRLRVIVLVMCVAITYGLVAPFNVILTPIGSIGFLTFMITGLSEEWIYRSVMIRVFQETIGIIWAVIFSSLLFMASHWGEVHAQTSLKIDLQGMTNHFTFGVVFGVIVWRSRAILWAAFLHCLSDWQPYTFSGRHWMLVLHIPWIGVIGGVQIYLIGLVGAEIIRFCTKHGVRNNVHSSSVLSHGGLN